MLAKYTEVCRFPGPGVCVQCLEQIGASQAIPLARRRDVGLVSKLVGAFIPVSYKGLHQG